MRLLTDPTHVPQLAQRRRDLYGFRGGLYTQSAPGRSLGSNWETGIVSCVVAVSGDSKVSPTEEEGMWIVWMNGQPDKHDG